VGVFFSHFPAHGYRRCVSIASNLWFGNLIHLLGAAPRVQLIHIPPSLPSSPSRVESFPFLAQLILLLFLFVEGVPNSCDLPLPPCPFPLFAGSPVLSLTKPPSRGTTKQFRDTSFGPPIRAKSRRQLRRPRFFSLFAYPSLPRFSLLIKQMIIKAIFNSLLFVF